MKHSIPVKDIFAALINSEKTKIRSAREALCHGALLLQPRLLPKSPVTCSSLRLPTAPQVGTSTWLALACLR